MATGDRQTFNAQTESGEQTGCISSGLKVVESDTDLRRRSLPSRIFSPNLGVKTINTPRSCSANGTCSIDTPITLSLPIEAKAAFEDSTPSHAFNTADNEKSDVTDHTTQVEEDPGVEKNDTSEESEAVNPAKLQSEDRTLAISREESGNKPQVLLTGPIHDALFTTKPQEPVQYLLRDKRKSLIPSEVNSCPQPQSADKTESMELRSQSYKETNANQKDTEGITREPHVDELNKTSGKETEISHDKVPSRTKHSDQKETTNIRKEEPNDTQDKADHDTEEQFDTIQPLALPPFLQSERRRRSSTASLQQFPTTPPSGQAGTSRSRRVSIVGAPHLSTPSTSEQTDTSQALREAGLRLQTQSSAGTSDVPGTRRGSQSRRSSVAASMMNSDHPKKGSIGFTLAASLVKWKINTLKAAKKANETIAKDAKHQEFMDRTADRIKTELPRPLLVSIQEEAYPIILRTAQAYRSQLGAKHKLTIQAYDRLADLIRDLKDPY